MKCPFCSHLGDKWWTPRGKEGEVIAGAGMPRVREAVHELRAIDESPVHGVKKDGTRERSIDTSSLAGC